MNALADSWMLGCLKKQRTNPTTFLNEDVAKYLVILSGKKAGLLSHKKVPECWKERKYRVEMPLNEICSLKTVHLT